MNNLQLTTELHYGFMNLTFPLYTLTWQSPWPEPRLLFLSSLRNNLTAQIYSHKTIISNAYIQCQSSSYKNVQQQIITKYHPGLTTPVKTPLWQSLSLPYESKVELLSKSKLDSIVASSRKR